MIGKDLEKAKKLLIQGNLVAIPTETVYGLAGNALDEKAVLKIFKVKNRPTFDPLIVHTHHIDQLPRWVTNLPEKAKKLAAALLPGALTLLLPKNSLIPDLVTSGLPLVAIRIPAHEVALDLLRQLDFPLAAPSANPFGYISPTTAQHVAAQLGDKIPYILDGGECKVGLESTIIGFEGNVPVVYRKGGVAIEVIENLIGKVELQEHSSSNPKAPGQLKSHYAPHTPFFFGQIDQLLLQDAKKYTRIGLLTFTPLAVAYPFAVQEVLSAQGDFAEAARNLFATMRKLDQLGLDAIFAVPLPEKDLGRAINDRLSRAAAR